MPTPFLSIFQTGFLHTMFASLFFSKTGKDMFSTREIIDDLQYSRLEYYHVLGNPRRDYGTVLIFNHGTWLPHVQGMLVELTQKLIQNHFSVAIISPKEINCLFGISARKETLEVIEEIKQINGRDQRILFLGCSIGALPFLDFLASEKSSTEIHAACFVCAPIFKISQNLSSNPKDTFISRLFSQSIKDALKSRKSESNHQLEIQGELNGTVKETIENIIGFESFKSADIQVENISCPTLLIFSADDPLIDFDTVDLVSLYHNTNIATAVTEIGGHCGFVQGLWKGKFHAWPIQLITDFFTGSVLPPSF
jgi:predicted alpha/beta-fold hydrolase